MDRSGEPQIRSTRSASSRLERSGEPQSRSARSASSRLDRSGEPHDLHTVFRIKVQGSRLEDKLKSDAHDLMKSA
jgi:hypothetical protein